MAKIRVQKLNEDEAKQLTILKTDYDTSVADWIKKETLFEKAADAIAEKYDLKKSIIESYSFADGYLVVGF